MKAKEKILEKIYEHSKPYIKLMSYYKCAMMEIETKFKVLNEEFSLESERNPISSIKTRLKSPISIEEKLRKKEVGFSIEAIENNLYDVAGIRVICNLPEDVYTIAEAFLKQDDVNLSKYKISMRSGENISASELCSLFGGGGHERAAGATIEADSPENAEKTVLERILAVLDKNG
jgi:ppGpp synthetase/RelA/SpoT-type nucleotidyltranferase